MSCTGCSPSTIQGVLVHEKGCPEAWRDESRECRWCGTEFKPEDRYQRFCGTDCKNAFEGHDSISYPAESCDD